MKLQPDSYKHIEFRDGKWRFKGLRANIVDTVSGMQSRGEAPEVVSKELSLSIVAIEEAMQFLNTHPEVITEHHRRMMQIANEHSRR